MNEKGYVHNQGWARMAHMVMMMATNGDQVLISWKRRKRKTKSYELKEKE
jgi:ribosomal protein S17